MTIECLLINGPAHGKIMEFCDAPAEIIVYEIEAPMFMSAPPEDLSAPFPEPRKVRYARALHRDQSATDPPFVYVCTDRIVPGTKPLPNEQDTKR